MSTSEHIGKEKPSDELLRRVAVLEGAVASSWALHTKVEYELEFRGKIKDEILAWGVKLFIGALVFLSGAGYFFVKSTIIDVYQTENSHLMSELRQKYEFVVHDERMRFEWKRHHDYGKSYIYLAEFYANSDIAEERRQELLDKQFKRAHSYFDYALASDPKQASTYWELGELYYTYPKEYRDTKWVDETKALSFYDRAVPNYTDLEISEGWRADPLRMEGKIYLKRVAHAQSKQDKNAALEKAEKLLIQAADEYRNAVPTSREYHEEHAREVSDLLLEIRRSREALNK